MKKTGPLCLNWSPLSWTIFILRRNLSIKKFKLKTRLSGDYSRESRKGGYQILLFIRNDDNRSTNGQGRIQDFAQGGARYKICMYTTWSRKFFLGSPPP